MANVRVDISYKALQYLASLGYSRVKFLLSEMSHTTPDICDEVASRFTGSNFATLSSVLANAPVFGSNPPAPIYGISHPACRCSYLVYPPDSIANLRLPGNPTDKQKEEVLKHMYPQQIWAGSQTPTIRDIDFNQFVNVTPERPVKKTNMEDQPWYQQTWDWIKQKIFRKASNYSDFVRYAEVRNAANNVRLGDLVKFIDEDAFVSEFGISTPLNRDFSGLALADYDNGKIFMYVANYNTVLPVDKNRLIRVANKDVPHQYLGKKVRIYSRSFGDYIEGIVFRNLEGTAWVYDFMENTMQHIPVGELHFIG